MLLTMTQLANVSLINFLIFETFLDKMLLDNTQREIYYLHSERVFTLGLTLLTIISPVKVLMSDITGIQM